MTAGLLGEARRVGCVLASVWRVCGRGGRIGVGLLAVSMVLAAGLLAVPTRVAWMSGALLLGLLLLLGAVALMVLLLLWMRLVVNVMQENHPHLARTVPGQVRALRTSLVGVALLTGAVAALFSASLGGPLLVVLAAVPAGLSLIAVMLRWPQWAGLVVLALAVSWPVFVPSATIRLVLDGMQAWPLLAEALALAVSLFALCRVVMDGGSRHAAAYRRGSAMAGAILGRQRDQQILPMGGRSWARHGWLQLLFGFGLYGRWLQSVPQRPGMSIQARLGLGLGPALHWTGQLGGLLAAGVVWMLPLFLLWSWTLPKAHEARGLGMFMAAFLPVSVLTAAMGWPAAMWRTRREQALLRLLPGVPQGTALNRWLACHMALLLVFIALFVSTVCVICIRRFDLDFEWALLEDFVLGCAVLSPWMLLHLWRDWSKLRVQSGGSPALVLAADLAIGGAAWAWVGLLDGAWWTLACLSALLFAPLGYWRWRLAVGAPVAWPVGQASGIDAGRSA